MEKAKVIRKTDIEEVLATGKEKGKHTLHIFGPGAKAHCFPFNILENTETESVVEIHKKNGDLWFCLEGEISFTCGGHIVNPYSKHLPTGQTDKNEIRAERIRGGEEILVKTGDWLWIPAGVPHQHKCLSSARLVIIKIPQA